MNKFLLFVLYLGAMLSIIPLAIWGMTGSLKQGWYALRSYLFCMGVIVVPVVLFVGITELPWLWSQAKEAIRGYLK